MIDPDAIAKRAAELRDFAKRGGILPDLRYFSETATMLDELVAEVGRLGQRMTEMHVAMVRITNETPFADEIKGWTDQRAAMVAEIGTLRARVVEFERMTEEASAADRNRPGC